MGWGKEERGAKEVGEGWKREKKKEETKGVEGWVGRVWKEGKFFEIKNI